MSIALYTTDSKANEVATHVPVEAAAVAGGVWWRGWLRGGWDDESSGSRPARLERCVGRYPPLPQSGGSCCLLHSPCLHIPHSTLPHSLTHSLTNFLTHYLIRAQHITAQPWSIRARSSPAPSACWPSSGRAPCRGATWTESESLPLTHSLTHFVSYFLTHSLTPLLGTLPPRCLGESPLWCARKP